ncbi:VWA domain-containing protein [Candidatus Woesearchaeota archaeon]|nr:VWA domain-containing protein [Candidatus Woesearchaeota archaeon]
MKGRKGYYFSMDAFLAASLILLGLFLMSIIYVKEQSAASGSFSKDAIGMLSTIKVSDTSNPYISELISNGTIKNSNLTILEQIGALWAENKTDYARKLAENLTSELIPQNYGFAIYADSELIYSNNKSQGTSLTVSKILVSGITKDKPFRGYSTKIILTSIQARTTSSYIYFGGFIGEGNITQELILPNRTSLIKEAYLELQSSDNFTLYINSAKSGTYTKSQSTTGNRADNWTISSQYTSNFKNGTNTINITYNTTGYITGGMMRLTYNTQQLNDTETSYFQDTNTATRREPLPGIKGIINIYSSIYIPGNLTAMAIHLHYSSDYNTYMNIGNNSVYSSQTAGEQTADIPDAQLSAKLDYAAISQRTVPIRLGSGAGNQTIIGQGTADIVLANDASGSMEWCAGTNCSTAVLGPKRYCNTQANYRPENGTYCDWATESYTIVNNGPVCSGRWHAYCTSNDSRKIDIALNASRMFSNTVLSTAGNQLGTVEYTNPWDNVIPQNGTWNSRYSPFPDSIAGRQNLTSNATAISQHLGKYLDAYWGTCICCGVQESVDMLTKLSNSTRKRSIVIMSDGEATDKCTGVGTGNAKTDAIKAAQDACTNYNISVYAVGFGTDADTSTLQSMASCNGSYYNATNVQQLADIYQQIANKLVTISYSAQEINTTGSGSFNAALYGDSYIELNYTPYSTAEFSKIPITLETARFGNNITTGTLNIPENTTLTAAKFTSYSGDKWTDNLTVRNTAEHNPYQLSRWSNDYATLGDPYIIDAPPSIFTKGENTILLSTGLNPANHTGGSPDNRAIYTLSIDASTSYTPVLSYADGCNWTINYEDGTTGTISIPSGYNGTKSCNYQNSSYDQNDAIDTSAYSLFQKLDTDKNGKLNVILSQEDLQLNTATINNIPSLWGPAVIEARIWQ